MNTTFERRYLITGPELILKTKAVMVGETLSEEFFTTVPNAQIRYKYSMILDCYKFGRDFDTKYSVTKYTMLPGDRVIENVTPIIGLNYLVHKFFAKSLFIRKKSHIFTIRDQMISGIRYDNILTAAPKSNIHILTINFYNEDSVNKFIPQNLDPYFVKFLKAEITNDALYKDDMAYMTDLDILH